VRSEKSAENIVFVDGISVLLSYRYTLDSTRFMMNKCEDANDKLYREESLRYICDVKEVLAEARGTDLAVSMVFEFFISNKVVRREMLASPSRQSTLLLIDAIREIRNICAAGKQKFPDIPLGEEMLIQQIGLLAMYRVLGVTAVKEALNEVGCDMFHTFMFNHLIPAPELEPFVVTYECV